MRLVEELQLVYPHLDKFQIQLVLDFDEMMRKKYGDDYTAEEYAHEIFPEDTVKAAETVQVAEDVRKQIEDDLAAVRQGESC